MCLHTSNDVWTMCANKEWVSPELLYSATDSFMKVFKICESVYGALITLSIV